MSIDTDTDFDRVVIVEGVSRRELSKTEFMSLPLSQRIRCVIERTARFYLGGEEVDRHRAINALRRDELG